MEEKTSEQTAPLYSPKRKKNGPTQKNMDECPVVHGRSLDNDLRGLGAPWNQQLRSTFCKGQLGRFFFIDSFIQNVLSIKQCIQISNHFHRWIPCVEIFKTRSHVDRFDELFFTKKPNRKHVFFPFRKNHARVSHEITTVPLAEEKSWLSWKKKK